MVLVVKQGASIAMRRLVEILLLSLPVVVVTQSNPCPICLLGPDRVPWPEKKLPNIGIPANDCFSVEQAALLFEDGSDICTLIQGLGTYCGCNRSPIACNLCWDGSEVVHKEKELPNYPVNGFLSTLPEGVYTNCESLQAFLHGSHNHTDYCREVQLDAGEDCGCPPIPTNENENTNNSTAGNSGNATGTNSTLIFGSNNSSNNNDNNTTSNSTTPTAAVSLGVDACGICENSTSPLPEPDKVLTLIDATSTCGEWNRLASAFPEDSDDCAFMRAGSRYCGCPLREGACTLCPNGEPVGRPNQQLDWLSSTFLSSTSKEGSIFRRITPDILTCSIMESIVAGEHSAFVGAFDIEPALFCTAAQLKSWICGCSPDWKPILLTWSYRISGMLSLMGSIAIVCTILTKPKNRFTTYNQLVLGISAFDATSSVAYILVGVMAPYEAGFYLSRGNNATCKTQGFLIQLGQTSMFYNMFLSMYYVLVISYNWKERQFKKYRLGVHIGLVVFGLALACGSLPFIGPQFGVCGILPPLTSSQWQVSLFYTAPVTIVLCVLTAGTITVCRTVYQHQKKAQRWMMDQKLTITRKVFWQSFWYMMAFYSTLPFILLSFYMPYRSPDYFWVFVATAVLAPLQGLMNAMIYFHRSKKIGQLVKSVCYKCSSRETVKRLRRSFLLPVRTQSTDKPASTCSDGAQGPNDQEPRIAGAGVKTEEVKRNDAEDKPVMSPSDERREETHDTEAGVEGLPQGSQVGWDDEGMASDGEASDDDLDSLSDSQLDLKAEVAESKLAASCPEFLHNADHRPNSIRNFLRLHLGSERSVQEPGKGSMRDVNPRGGALGRRGRASSMRRSTSEGSSTLSIAGIIEHWRLNEDSEA